MNYWWENAEKSQVFTIKGDHGHPGLPCVNVRATFQEISIGNEWNQCKTATNMTF